MITATLTRPTSISPTTSTETKVALIEKIDVGLVPIPRESKVTMHAITKRPKRKRTGVASPPPVHRTASTSDPPEPVLEELTRASGNSNDISANLDEPLDSIPRSPLQTDSHENQSERSAESVVSVNSNSARGADASGGSCSTSRVSGCGADEREITATVELQKGGCLPGDLLPVKIHVEHNRRVKSMHGIIVTFYRQGRVDYAPPLSSFENMSAEDARKLEREEYFPRSRTGLGGLSLSSAGSCSVFRKDLSQSVSPLIIDPNTLSANIATSVRVPENVFPSIKSVPGGLISFKYHVEVVVDLGGRLAGQTHGTPQEAGRLGGAASMTRADSFEANLGRLANWNGTIVDTDYLRREKGVISVSFEVVVGTTDSSRSRGKAIIRAAPSAQETPTDADESNYTWQSGNENGERQHTVTDEPIPYEQSQGYFATLPHAQTSYQASHGQSTPTSRASAVPMYVPPPEVPRQEGMSEKELVAQAEMRLLPSQPPNDPTAASSDPAEGSSSHAGPSSGPSTVTFEASAPVLDQEPASSCGNVVGAHGEPSAPTTPSVLTGSHFEATDDKQELQRRRLLMEASAPPEAPNDSEVGEPSAPPPGVAGSSDHHEPSAPRLDDEEAYGNHDTFGRLAGPSAPTAPGSHHHGAEPLPRYER
jgi:arrestin-related trafficking adapter 9